MLIGLVRDSVMQCFCHSCSVPILPAVGKRSTAPLKKPTKVRSKQPKASSKKVKFITTEIRCQEKSRGGLCYEVILAEPSPNTAQPVVMRNKDAQNKGLSAAEIERKLKEAEQRRLSLEAKKMADWTAKQTKIEEIARKKDELNHEFITHTKEALHAKMEHSVEKREAIITEVKEKLKEHSAEIERTRLSLEQQKIIGRLAIEDKLKSAAQIREENIRKTMDRLKEHNTIKMAEVKIAADARETEKCMEKRHVFANKLYIAEQNREKELQKKLEALRKHERRAEMVRQNKAALSNNTSPEIENNSIVEATA